MKTIFFYKLVIIFLQMPLKSWIAPVVWWWVMNWSARVSAVVCHYPRRTGRFWTVNMTVLLQQRTPAASSPSPLLVSGTSKLPLHVSVRISLVWQKWKSKCTIMLRNPKVTKSCVLQAFDSFCHSVKHLYELTIILKLGSCMKFLLFFFHFSHVLVSWSLSTPWIFFTLSVVVNVIFISCLTVILR